MLHIFIAALLITLSGSQTVYGCDVPTSDTCDKNILSCCDNDFRAGLNISTSCNGSALYDAPECVRKEIEKHYAVGGIEGLFVVCAGFYNYRNCLGRTWRSCTTPKWLVSNSYTVQQAQHFATVFGQFSFACGAGIDSYLNEDACMASVFRQNESFLSNCRTEFYNNVAYNPNEKCMYLNTLMKCYEKPFDDMCGVEAAWWGCEYERTGTQVFYPDCSPQCVVGRSVNNRQLMAPNEIEKEEDAETAERTDNNIIMEL